MHRHASRAYIQAMKASATNEELTPTQRAVDLAGGPTAVAKVLGISHQAVMQWTHCPATRAVELSRLSGVSCHVLRPDIFPVPASTNNASRLAKRGIAA